MSMLYITNYKNAFELQANMNIERLNLSGNWMEGLGGAYMAAMLTDNDFITHLVRIVESIITYSIMLIRTLKCKIRQIQF